MAALFAMVEFVRLNQISMEQGYTREINLKREQSCKSQLLKVTKTGKPPRMFSLAYKNVEKNK